MESLNSFECLRQGGKQGNKQRNAFFRSQCFSIGTLENQWGLIVSVFLSDFSYPSKIFPELNLGTLPLVTQFFHAPSSLSARRSFLKGNLDSLWLVVFLIFHRGAS